MSDNTVDDIGTDRHEVLDKTDIPNIFRDLSLLQKELEENWNEGDDDSILIPELPLKHTTEEKYHDHEKEELTYCHPAHLYDENNMIEYENFFEETVKIKGPHVQLDDLGSYLKRSERFCGLCNILFSSRSEYEEHNIAVHLQDCLQDCLAALLEDKLESPLDVTGNDKVHASRKQTNKRMSDKTHLLCKTCGRFFKTVAALNFHYKIRKCNQILPKMTDCSLAEKTKLLCKTCGRLFRTVAALNFHHKIRKCIQIIPKTTGKKLCQSYVKKEADKTIHSRSRVCSHCNTMFATEEALFDHMYDMDISQTNENISCKVEQGSAIALSMIPKLSKLKKKINKKNKKNKSTKNVCKKESNRSETKINPRKILIPKEKRFYYRCPVCASYFARVEKFVDHLNMNKVIKAAETFKKVTFDPKCPHCQSIPNGFCSYKTHVISTHRQELHENYLKISRNFSTEKIKSIKKQASLKTRSKLIIKPRTIKDSKKKAKSHATSKTKGIQDVPMQKETKVSRDLIVPSNITGARSIINVRDNYPTTAKEENTYMNVHENIFINVPIHENSDNLKYSNEFGTDNNAPFILDSTTFINVPIHENSDNLKYSNEFGTDNNAPFILDSTLFRCHRCDVHFVSAKTAINHYDHMELLIHWKCSKCNRILKKEEEESHEKQHLVSNFYRVHDLHLNSTTDISKILYKCVHCAVHFNDSNFVSHFINCGSKQDLVYCKHCDIFIDDVISESHEAGHQHDVDLSDFIIVEAEILGNSNSFKDTPKTKSSGTKRKSKCNANSHEPTKKGKYDYLLNMCYCDTCQCFLTDSLKRNVHIESRCGHLKKHICKLCGLVLTPRTYQSHKNMHDRIKNLQLKHFRFRDLRSGKNISPPVPTFPKCDQCDIHFPSKKARHAHVCVDDLFLTCHVCDKKFSEHAFKLHMAFHNFDDLSFVTKIESNVESIETFYEDIPINEINETFETSCNKMFLEPSYDNYESTNVTNDTKKCYGIVLKIEEASSSSPDKHSLTSNGYGNEIPKDIAKHHMNQTLNNDNYDILGSDPVPISNSEISRSQGTVQLNKPLELTLFKCKVCQITFDTYDKVVLHCQWHYVRCQKTTIPSKTCSFCLNVFESSCFNDHENWHIDNPKQDIMLLQFDVSYFRSENDIWLNHLFGSVTKKQMYEIMGNSIYKFECRIKLEVVQSGETELTVYKCERCQCFIDVSLLYRHSENSCFKLRKHPCSYCGLPFIASFAKLNHEKLHENRDNISLKSYRMVVFNRKDDEHFNNKLKSSNNYIMYQCRNCNSVSDICQWKYHKCSHDLKQCGTCGLLLKNSDFELHTTKHRDLHDFVVSNMKVILYGIKNDQNDISDNKAEYQGLIKDYTFYKCNECQTSFETMHELEEHICSFGSHQLKCRDCDLNVPSTKLKIHRKLHEIDEDLVNENIQIISTCSSRSTSTPKNVDGMLTSSAF